MTDKMPPHWLPIGLVGADEHYLRSARAYAEDYARTHAAAVAAPLVEALVSFTKSSYIRHQHPIRFAKAVAALAAYKEQK